MTNQRNQQLMRWLPRVLAIVYAGFIGLFALDVWSMEGTFWERLGGFLIHLAPTYAVIVALIIAWRWPLVGGVLFMALAVTFAILFSWEREWLTLLILGLPLVIIGLLFLGEAWLERKQVQPRF